MWQPTWLTALMWRITSKKMLHVVCTLHSWAQNIIHHCYLASRRHPKIFWTVIISSLCTATTSCLSWQVIELVFLQNMQPVDCTVKTNSGIYSFFLLLTVSIERMMFLFYITTFSIPVPQLERHRAALRGSIFPFSWVLPICILYTSATWILIVTLTAIVVPTLL